MTTAPTPDTRQQDHVARFARCYAQSRAYVTMHLASGADLETQPDFRALRVVAAAWATRVIQSGMNVTPVPEHPERLCVDNVRVHGPLDRLLYGPEHVDVGTLQLPELTPFGWSLLQDVKTQLSSGEAAASAAAHTALLSVNLDGYALAMPHWPAGVTYLTSPGQPSLEDLLGHLGLAADDLTQHLRRRTLQDKQRVTLHAPDWDALIRFGHRQANLTLGQMIVFSEAGRRPHHMPGALMLHLAADGVRVSSNT